jgi:hypothetical protein
MEIIATYSEKRFDGARTFTLLPDKILVSGKQSLTSDFDVTIPLVKLSPEPDRMRVRNSMFGVGMWMALIGFIGSGILVSGLHMTFAQSMPGLVAGLGFVGLVLMANCWQKVDWVRFQNDGGLVVLDIARAGKQAVELDAFVAALTKQIKIARNLADGERQR